MYLRSKNVFGQHFKHFLSTNLQLTENDDRAVDDDAQIGKPEKSCETAPEYSKEWSVRHEEFCNVEENCSKDDAAVKN